MLLQNAIVIKEPGQPEIFLKSSHRHDYVGHELSDGSYVFVDGGDVFHDGGYYTRGAGPHPHVGDFSLTEDSTWEEICACLLWGTRGKDGKQPLQQRPLSTFERDHLEAILKNCPTIAPLHKSVIAYLLATWEDSREEN